MSVPRATPIHGLRTVVWYCLERDTLVRSTKTGLVVGTILALINHGQQLLSGRFSPEWVIPMLLTYLVPFSVATYGQVKGKRQRDRLHTVDTGHSAVH
jgi:hypothetical protein